MIWPVDLIVLVMAIITAFAAITVKDLLSAAILLSAYSFFLCLMWTIMGAVDVAFTEATVGAGVSTVFCVAAIYNTSRRTKD